MGLCVYLLLVCFWGVTPVNIYISSIICVPSLCEGRALLCIGKDLISSDIYVLIFCR